MVAGFLAKPSPRMPAAGRWAAGGMPFAAAASLHVTGIIVLFWLAGPSVRPQATADVSEMPAVIRVVLPRLVFKPAVTRGAGGGGGGNRQTGPIRQAQGVGRDSATLKTGRPHVLADRGITTQMVLPPVVLEARPLASGTVEQMGLPTGGAALGTSTGPGSGGGVGTGVGTGIGPGRGPGSGSGSGGGTGGGAYRPGGAVTAPRVLSEVKPRYTSGALSAKIEGSVWLELVVNREGRAEEIRVLRSLDAGGLDAAAIEALRLWRFAPGRLAGSPVDVLVTVVMDFSIQ